MTDIIVDRQNNFGLSLSALRSGDRAEIARMVDFLSPQVFRLALRILGNEQDAEDVLQETFIKAIQSLKTFEGRSNISTWIYRIATNEALMVLRKGKKIVIPIEEEPSDEDDDYQSMQLTDWCCMPEFEFLSSESQNILDQAIAKLPDNLRLVFILRDIEGFSIKETAETLNLTEVNVKTRLLRARLNLRQALSLYFGERVKERRYDGT